jgi:predicted aspartyl protease
MPIESFGNHPLKILERGPVIGAVIALPFDRPQPQEPAQKTPESLHQVSCLLDTGATNCCINPSLAAKLNLPISGYSNSTDASNNTVQGKVRKASLGFIFKNSVIGLIPAVQFFELPQDLANHNIIIGRSLMAKFRSMYFCFKTGEYMIHF